MADAMKCSSRYQSRTDGIVTCDLSGSHRAHLRRNGMHSYTWWDEHALPDLGVNLRRAAPEMHRLVVMIGDAMKRLPGVRP